MQYTVSMFEFYKYKNPQKNIPLRRIMKIIIIFFYNVVF